MSDQTPGASKGLFESLTVLAASLVAIAHTRLDLLSTDVEEDRERFTALLLLMLIAMFCLGVGVVLLTILLVVAFWDHHQLLVLAGLTSIFLAGGTFAWSVARQKLKTKPRLFAGSMAEFSKDRQQLTQRG